MDLSHCIAADPAFCSAVFSCCLITQNGTAADIISVRRKCGFAQESFVVFVVYAEFVVCVLTMDAVCDKMMV